MRDNQPIIEEYRQSDVIKRVYLFLEFRELRGEFSEIDRKEGFIDIKNETDAVPSYQRSRKIDKSTFISSLREWIHRFRKCFQGSA